MKVKNVLITGSTSGIGLAIATAFAKSGYNLVFHGLEKDGAELAAEIGKQNRINTFFSSANLLDSDEISAMVNEATAHLGDIDILVNNAGIQYVSPVEDFPLNKWNDIIAVNLTAAFCTSQAVWKGMKAKKWGRIINISSAHGLVASENKSAYVASKHGVVGLTKALALEGSGYGITVNAICPGFVKTPLVEKQIKDLAQQQDITESEVIQNNILQKHAVKNFVSPEEIAALALFLASESASMITGTSMPVDGGWTAQ
ncbi:MAG: 3-hydroxybutyrate dehydrogenase [Daejeonella sp.]|uniref:3-hydroxybutyrate dehydrogenase n=1 Tax=Daejeonella sp. TaxID=2805397 RepID=UPI0027377166|nr:3-hydroxybutyrate dehydrogenase [Daejeonella sp.]MDP3467721.1 3-hydroxybutyrate dehydrogenase [Daejeonella sp.]